MNFDDFLKLEYNFVLNIVDISAILACLKYCIDVAERNKNYVLVLQLQAVCEKIELQYNDK